MGVATCVRHTHYSVSWLHRELHRRRQWQGSHGGLGPSRHTPLEDRGPIGSSTEGPQWQGSHGGPAPSWRTPHTVRGPIRGSTEDPSGRVHMAAPPHFGAPFTRFVAP